MLLIVDDVDKSVVASPWAAGDATRCVHMMRYLSPAPPPGRPRPQARVCSLTVRGTVILNRASQPIDVDPVYQASPVSLDQDREHRSSQPREGLFKL